MKTAISVRGGTQRKGLRSFLLKMLVMVTTVVIAISVVVATLGTTPALASGPHDTAEQPGAPTRTPTSVFIETAAPTDIPFLTPLTGRIYNDLNSNNTYDDGEGLANVGLFITDAHNVSRGAITDLRGGFALNLPPGQTWIAVNESSLPSGLQLQSGNNPSIITLLSGVPFTFNLSYRAQALSMRLTPIPTLTPVPSVTPGAPLPTSTLPVQTPTLAVATVLPSPTLVVTPFEVALTSKANVSATPSSSSGVSADTSGVEIGDQIDYSVTVKVNSANPSELTVSVPVPEGTEYVSGSAWPNDERAESRLPQSSRHNMTWRVSPLANGQTFTARFSVRVMAVTGSIATRANATNISTGQSMGSNEVVNNSRPTAVALLRFEAIPTTNNGIRIMWQTSTELDAFGFAVYRGLDGDSRSNAVLLNPKGLIPARGGTGETYEFVDDTAEAGQRYAYWLHEIERNGRINEYGPLQTSTAVQTTASIVVPSNVMAGGVPVVPPSGGSQNIPVPATPAVINSGSNHNSGAVQMLVTQVVQQQVIVPTIAVPLPAAPLGDSQLPTPQPVDPVQAAPAVATTLEPLPQPIEPTAAPIYNSANAETNAAATATPNPPPINSDSGVAVATIEVPAPAPTAQPITQAQPLPEVNRAASAVRETTSPRSERQIDWMAWIFWALMIFAVWFVVAGILGIILGQYLRQR